MCNVVTDRMKVFTRPYVAILGGGAVGKETEVGTGTFIEKGELGLVTCEHVARFNPAAFYLDGSGSSELKLGRWRAEPDPGKDVALAPVPATEWSHVSGRAQPLPMSKFAQRHATAERELLFFRGIAGENAYVGSHGADGILSGYCSQEKIGTGDANIFEILWHPPSTILTSGTSSVVQNRLRYDNPAGFSGSLVWNTRFVELGCDLSSWSPSEAVVTGLLRRFDEKTNTLLAWRVEHLLSWL